MAHSEEDIELPDKSGNGKSSQVALLSTERDDMDNALDALSASKRRKIDEAEKVASAFASATESGSSTKTRAKKGKAKADGATKVKTTKVDKGKRANHSGDSVNNSDELEDFDMVDRMI